MLAAQDFRQLRMTAGLRQQDLAELIDMDRSAVSRVESGERALTIEEAARWAEACGMQLLAVPRDQQGSLDSIALVPPSRRAVAQQLLELLRTITDDDISSLEVLLKHWASRKLVKKM